MKRIKIAAMIIVIIILINIFFILEPPFIDTLEVKAKFVFHTFFTGVSITTKRGI